MKNIIIKNTKGTVFLPKEFYTEKVIKDSVSDYSQATKCFYRISENYYVINFEDKDVDYVINEFLNYVNSNEFLNLKDGLQ